MKNVKVPRRKNNKVKGTVLYTVVSVLMIMIILIMAALTISASASKRAYNSYSKAQTQYSARAAVESVKEAMKMDSGFANAIKNLSSGSITLNATLPDTSMGQITNLEAAYVKKEYVTYVETDDTGAPVLNPDGTQKIVTNAKDIIQISATAQLGNETSTVSMYLMKDPNTPPVVNPRSASFVAMGSSDISVATNALGGFTVGIDTAPAPYPNGINHGSTFYQISNGNNAKLLGDLFCYGDLTFSVGYDMHLGQNTDGTTNGVAIWGDVHLTNSDVRITSELPLVDAYGAPISYSAKDLPYFFVSGTLYTDNQNYNFIQTGGTTPVNAFVGSIKQGGSGGFNYVGNIYAFDGSKTNELGNGSGSTALLDWTGSINGLNNDDISGNFYSMGDVIVANNTNINGDLMIEGDLIINGSFNVTGDLAVKGDVKINAGGTGTVGGILYLDYPTFNSAKCQVIYDTMQSLGLTFPALAFDAEGGGGEAVTIDGLDTDVVKNVNDLAEVYPKNFTYAQITGYDAYLVNGETVDANNKIIPDVETIRTQYFNNDGTIKANYMRTNPTPSSTIYNYFEGQKAKFIDAHWHTVTETDISGPYNDGGATKYHAIETPCTLTGSANCDIWINPGASTLDINIDSLWLANGHKIIVVYDPANGITGTVNFYMASTSMLGLANNSAIVTSQYYDRMSGSTIDLGGADIYNDTNFAPNINIYMQQNARMYFNSPSFVTAQIYAPDEVEVKFDNGFNITNFTYNGVAGLDGPYNVVGITLGDSIKTANNGGTVFVNGASGGGGGAPIITPGGGKYEILYYQNG